MEQNFLISIAIPTFNRAKELEANLKILCSEISDFEVNNVEIIVSDNCSEDNTNEVCKNYINKPYFSYYKQSSNIGGDKNFLWLYQNASGRYILLLSDDDRLLTGQLKHICETISRMQPDVIVLRPFSFLKKGDWKNAPLSLNRRPLITTNKKKFVFEVGVMSTLISAVVIKKKCIDFAALENYTNSFLIQVPAFYSAVISGSSFVIFRHYSLAYKRTPNPGYNFCEVFVTNYLEITKEFFSQTKLNLNLRKFISILILNFYPFGLRHFLYRSPSIEEIYALKALKQSCLYYPIIFPIVGFNKIFKIPFFFLIVSFLRLVNGDLPKAINILRQIIRK